MKLTFWSHSCFLIETGGHRLVVDPFLSGNPLAPVKAPDDAFRATDDRDDARDDDRDRAVEPPAEPFSDRFSSGRYRLKTIVIDPGHGGEEEGAMGPTGLLEKDVVLDVSRRLRSRLLHR